MEDIDLQLLVAIIALSKVFCELVIESGIGKRLRPCLAETCFRICIHSVDDGQASSFSTTRCSSTTAN